MACFIIKKWRKNQALHKGVHPYEDNMLLKDLFRVFSIFMLWTFKNKNLTIRRWGLQIILNFLYVTTTKETGRKLYVNVLRDMHLYIKISQFLRSVYKKVPPSFCILDSFLPRVIVCYPRDFAPHIENASIDFNLLFQSARFFASRGKFAWN